MIPGWQRHWARVNGQMIPWSRSILCQYLIWQVSQLNCWQQLLPNTDIQMFYRVLFYLVRNIAWLTQQNMWVQSFDLSAWQVWPESLLCDEQLSCCHDMRSACQWSSLHSRHITTGSDMVRGWRRIVSRMAGGESCVTWTPTWCPSQQVIDNQHWQAAPQSF